MSAFKWLYFHESIEGLDAALLAQPVPTTRGGIVAASELLRRWTSGHAADHLDELERALGG